MRNTIPNVQGKIVLQYLLKINIDIKVLTYGLVGKNMPGK